MWRDHEQLCIQVDEIQSLEFQRGPARVTLMKMSVDCYNSHVKVQLFLRCYDSCYNLLLQCKLVMNKTALSLSLPTLYPTIYSQTCVKRLVKRLTNCGLIRQVVLTQVNYSENHTFGTLEGWSLNIGDIEMQVVLRTG